MSLGGLFIRTKKPPQTGTMIQFLIDIPETVYAPARLSVTSRQAKEWASASSR
jgi:hypothetical protein